MSDERKKQFEAAKLEEARERLWGMALGLAALFGPTMAARLLLETNERLLNDAQGIVQAPRGGTA